MSGIPYAIDSAGTASLPSQIEIIKSEGTSDVLVTLFNTGPANAEIFGSSTTSGDTVIIKKGETNSFVSSNSTIKVRISGTGLSFGQYWLTM